ncbi:hypothetical protein C8R42DRAFT_672675 [Lentinula raphanica]|nr:hypothetical protein C8R42DRAFT_672675 [Lentinula raphanica]
MPSGNARRWTLPLPPNPSTSDNKSPALNKGNKSSTSQNPDSPSRKASVSSQTDSSSITIDIATQPSYPGSDATIEAQHSIGMMNESLNTLEHILQRLSEGQDSGQGAFAGNDRLDEEIKQIHKDLEAIRKNQTDGVEEIDLLMKKFLEETAEAKLKDEVNQEIERGLDGLVRDEVQAYLQDKISPKMQEQFEQRKKELEKAHRELHNSESKRLNSLLSERNIKEPLHTIYNAQDKISEHFPKTLKDLVAYDADTLQALIKEYGIDSPDNTTKRGNLNRFMVFCGLQLSLIANGKITQDRTPQKPTK